MASRRQVLMTAAGFAAASALGVGTGYYTFYIEPHWVEEVHLKMPVKNLPPDLKGRTLVQLSDIHVGRKVDDDYVLKVFDRVRALNPDIVTITGDFVSHHRRIVDQAAQIYRHMPQGRLATVGILGNHDYGSYSADVGLGHLLHGIFDDAGMTVLKNQAIDIHGLQLIGLDDRWGPFFDPAPVMATVEAGAPTIVLSHNPDTADMPFWGAFDGWILAGHTHGGQCKPPFFRPPLLPVYNKSYVAGSYDLSGDRTLYINRGIGHLIQARFNVRPEITVFSLTNKPLNA
ncbi:MAG: metallophosphoesterase [Alphaproteobacteria bacterium]|nr:metallophosphoesterase [Alphaproteobacteria bacterium]